jgi:tRNA threonylcarbamoyl adenosine modification protein YeaZ
VSAAGTTILAIDTATSVAVAALGDAAGRLVAEEPWVAGYRHGEELLPRIGRLLETRSIRIGDLAAIVVGIGPGAFTGLRVGIATAKALAHALERPIIGISTGEALIAATEEEVASTEAAAEPADPPARKLADPAATERAAPSPATRGSVVLLLPAGPSDRVLVRHGSPPRLLPGGTEPELATGETLVAVDLDGRAPAGASTLGDRARRRLGASLVRLGAVRLAAGDTDDLAELVPEYVTLPRGVRSIDGEVAWSRDPR